VSCYKLRGANLYVQMFDPAKLRICFLAGTLGRGGAERQLVYMLRALIGAGVQTRVLCLTKGESFEKDIRALDVSVEYVSSASGSRAHKLVRIIRSLRHERADVLHSVHFYTNLYAATAGRFTGTREIGAIRSNLYSELSANGAMGRFHLRTPRHLIANSEFARDRAISAGIKPENIDVLPNVVEVEKTSTGLTSELDDSNGQDPKSNGKVRLLFVGRLTNEKRADRFLRVVSRVKREAPNYRVTAAIAGNGPLRPELEAMADSLGLENGALKFLGEREDMNAVYKKTDLLMLTSDYEGTPNAILEAMSNGLPIVATRVGGVPDILHKDRGMLVDPDDEDGFTTAALRLVTDPALRTKLGNAGREYVSRFHSPETLGNRLLTIYRKALYK
jgi:glycosyltransferase involved in cell wall biosynthesis